MARSSDQSAGPSRRALLAGFTGALGAASASPFPAQAEKSQLVDDARGAPINLVLQVNGQARRMAIDSRTTLLDALRNNLGLTGSKKGCDHGQCGACTVHVGGRRVLGCLTLALSVQNREITTIEGLARHGRLHVMQESFIEQDAFQCGYCTPGQIMSAVACVEEGHAGSDDEIREYMSGNLCRCAAYPKIVAAIREAAGKMRA